jgi:uncharacterized protein (TIRG00374 family)
MKQDKWRIPFTIAGIFIFSIYLAYTNPFKVLTEVGKFNPTIFALAIGVNYVGLFFLASSWHILLLCLDIKSGLWKSIQVSFVGLFVVWLLPFPSGFDIVRAYLIKDDNGGNWGKAISSVVVNKVYYFLSFGIMISIGALIVKFINNLAIPIQSEFIWFTVLYAVVNTAFFLVILSPNILRKFYKICPYWIKSKLSNRIYSEEYGLEGFNEFIQEIEDSIKILRKSPLKNLLSLILIGFHWSTGAITAYMVAYSLNHPVDFWVIILIYAVIEFIQQLNIFIPSGLGIVDAGLTGAFVIIGVPLNIASAISLLTRLATYWFELLLCGLVSIQFGYKEALSKYFS